MHNRIKDFLTRSLTNIPGWRTNRKIIVFESDDWGSIRMPDKRTYNYLLSKGIQVDRCAFNKYDSLESGEDLIAVFDVLGRFRDKNGSPPVITANCVSANPDFEKINKDNFETYHYEAFTETYRRYPGREDSLRLWKEGINSGYLYPQFHGREHLNVTRWMAALRSNMPETLMAFDNRMFGISKHISTENRESYLAAFDNDGRIEDDGINNILAEGISVFNHIFGFSSKSFIAPNYIWSSEIEKTLSKLGINHIQGKRLQFSPGNGLNNYNRISHFTGERNKVKQIYTVRNCVFEPSLHPGKDEVSSCLTEINNSFFFGKPAIIESHRLNFIGSLDLTHRTENLKKFNELLAAITRRWPDAEFLTTEQLGTLIANRNL
jgi:hypothetical protein